MKKIIAILFATLIAPVCLAQSILVAPITWTASTTGAVQLNSNAVFTIPAMADTLNLTINSLGATGTATVHLYVSASAAGPWSTDCPGGSINGAAITVNTNSSVNLNCYPLGVAFAQIYVTATGGGTLYGAITATNRNLASLPISGGTVTGDTTFSGGFTATGFPNQFYDSSGSAAQFYMQSNGYDQWAVTACGYGCAGGGQAFGIGTRGTGWISPFIISQSSSTNAIVGINGALGISATTTVVNCSTSGTATFSEPDQGVTDKRCVVLLANCTGTASYTYPTAFTTTPGIVATSQVAAGIFTTVSTISVTVTGSTTTGTGWLIGS